MAALRDIRRIVVFRALMLGDLLCATPALRALRAGFPDARITLVGLPWASELAARLDSIDDFIEFPGWPGLPERRVDDPWALLRFLHELRGRRYDLAVQLHGSGGIVNPLVGAFGARHCAGFVPSASDPADDGRAQPHAADAALHITWADTGTEVERLLRLTDHLGLPRRGHGLDFPLNGADHHEAERLLAPATQGVDRDGKAPVPPYAIVHPGSQLPSRRWPVERFAAVADGLAGRGLAIVLTGSATERPLTAAVAAHMSAPATDLAGHTGLWTLGALVARAALLLSNDTGLSHVAAALATPSVIVSSGGDAPRWTPADTQRHRVLWHDMPCRPCSHVSCPIGHGCALGVAVEPVRRAALQALQTHLPQPA